jgi:hypothetical protein
VTAVIGEESKGKVKRELWSKKAKLILKCTEKIVASK